MPCTIYGMPISANVIPSVLLALDNKCGKMEQMDIMEGQHKTPDKMEINPFGQMPSMKDGDFCLAEGNAILRYMARKFAPAAYGSGDPDKMAMIDWALDWCSTNFSKQYNGIWYPVAGFGNGAEDPQKNNEAAVANIELFAKTFLSKTKFVAGDSPSIADYKVVVHFWYLDFPAVKAHSGFELPACAKKYVHDFLEACPSKDFLQAARDFMASKEKKE